MATGSARPEGRAEQGFVAKHILAHGVAPRAGGGYRPWHRLPAKKLPIDGAEPLQRMGTACAGTAIFVFIIRTQSKISVRL